ncbi:MAG: molecular chaperone TorD family protein [Coriobacteriaceae bacterium]|jgi:TorA maturation chaperone TorD|nr:molecular chaperone TorD family protein [Coriobacteriaceae bacterium]
MKENENALFARAESLLIGRLSRNLLRPRIGLAEELLEGSYRHQLERFFCDKQGHVEEGIGEAFELLDRFLDEIKGLTAEELRLMLEVDYNRLFVGPGHLLAPPYESYYESVRADAGLGRLRTQAEREVTAIYAEHGYTMPDVFVDLPDHAAIELEFISLLMEKEAQLWENGSNDEAAALQADIAGFVNGHFAAWFPQCAARIRAEAKTGFYPMVALLACRLLLADTEG